MKRFLTIGGATKDIFINFENEKIMKLSTKTKTNSYILLEEGLKIDVANIHNATGGGATNSAVSLKKLGLNVSSCFKVGKDKAGEFIIEELNNIGISTEFVTVSAKHDTAISYILPTLNHNYTALCYRGANKYLEKRQMPFTTLSVFDYVYITSLSGNSAYELPHLAKASKENNLFVINNPGSTQIIKLPQTILDALPYIDLFILNAVEAEQFFLSILPNNSTKKFNLVVENSDLTILKNFVVYQGQNFGLLDFFCYINKLGPKIIVVTNGAQGVYVFTKEFILYHPSIEAKVISSIGAGDAFGSCFSGCLALNIPIEKALIYGLINSSSVISHIDTKQGLLTFEELESKFEKIGFNKLQKIVIKN